MDAPSVSSEGSNHDFCDSIVSHFACSDDESHQLLCAVVVAMSQELKEGNLPSAPDAYFGVACSFLDRIASEPSPQSHVLDALLTVFCLLVPSVPMAVLKDRMEFFSELVVRVLQFQSPSESSVVSGISSYHRGQYIDFAVSVLPGLTDVAINELHQKAIAPALQDADGLIQKKAYKALSIVLKSSDSFVSSKFEGLFKLMVESSPPKLFPAKRHRLDCLSFLLIHLSKSVDDPQVMRRQNAGSFLSEIILAVKEDDKKTRNQAYDILVKIGHAVGDEETGGNREKLHQFCMTIARGLRAAFQYFVSAVVKSLAHLASNFADLVIPAFDCLRRTYLLRPTESREIIKASLGLLKVIVVESQAEWLQMHLQCMVEGLLKWQNITKNHFKEKAELLMGMLVTRCGLGAVKAVMPEEHMNLLTSIPKIQEWKARKRGAKSEETRSHFSKATSRQRALNHTKVFPDSDEDSCSSDAKYVNAKTISRGGNSSLHLKSAASLVRSNMRLKKNLPEHLSNESEDEPLDLLDHQGTRSAVRSFERLKRKSRSDDEVELDSEGGLIICEEGKQMEKPTESEYVDRNEPDSHLFGKSGTEGHMIKRMKTSDTGWAYTGKEYASKKAGGRVKRKDKLEPYACWPSRSD